jgi:hypothetical protein
MKGDSMNAFALVEAWNSRSVSAVVALYAEDAVRHQIAVPEVRLEGRAAIAEGVGAILHACPDAALVPRARYDTTDGRAVLEWTFTGTFWAAQGEWWCACTSRVFGRQRECSRPDPARDGVLGYGDADGGRRLASGHGVTWRAVPFPRPAPEGNCALAFHPGSRVHRSRVQRAGVDVGLCHGIGSARADPIVRRRQVDARQARDVRRHGCVSARSAMSVRVQIAVSTDRHRHGRLDGSVLLLSGVRTRWWCRMSAS